MTQVGKSLGLFPPHFAIIECDEYDMVVFREGPAIALPEGTGDDFAEGLQYLARSRT